jgi:Phage tail tube protein
MAAENCSPPIGNSSSSEVRYALHTDCFRDPFTPGVPLQILPVSSWTFSPEKTSEASDDLRSDGLPSDSVVTGFGGTAQLGIQMRFGAYDWALESLLRAHFVSVDATGGASFALPNPGSGQQVVTYATTVPANTRAGSVLRISGATQAGNNGDHPVVAVNTVAKTVTLYNPDGAVEAASGARVKGRSLRPGTEVILHTLEGYHASNGAYQRAEACRVSQFTLTVAEQARITGTINLMAREIVYPVYAVRVGAGTAGNFHLTGATITGAANVWNAIVDADGTNDGGVTLGDFISISGDPHPENNGLFKVTARTSAMLTLETPAATPAAFTDSDSSPARVVVSKTVGDGKPLAPDSHSIMNSSTNVGALQKNGQPYRVALQQWSTDINGNLTRVNQVGSASAADIVNGTFAFTGNLTLYYESNADLNAMKNDLTLSLSISLIDPEGNSMVFTFYRVKYATGSTNQAGQNQPTTADLTYSGFIHPTYQTVMTIDALAA